MDSGDVRVRFSGRTWTINPAALDKVYKLYLYGSPNLIGLTCGLYNVYAVMVRMCCTLCVGGHF